jgi:hypothetical protein
MRKTFLFLSIWLLAVFCSKAQPSFLNQAVLGPNYRPVFITDQQPKPSDNDIIIIEKGVNGAIIKTLRIRTNLLNLPNIFFQEKGTYKEAGGTQPAAISNRLLDESKSLFQKFVTSISFFHFLIDKEVVKKNTTEIQPPGLKFNSSFEIQSLQARH